MYDLPLKPFSLAEAQKIEQESWTTTQELLEAFDENEEAAVPMMPLAIPVVQSSQETTDDFRMMLGKFLPFAMAVLKKDSAMQRKEAECLGKMPEAIVDEINEKAVEFFGDILIEDSGDGLEVIDCYEDVLCGGTV